MIPEDKEGGTTLYGNYAPSVQPEGVFVFYKASMLTGCRTTKGE
jgi:hypothetical protein